MTEPDFRPPSQQRPRASRSASKWPWLVLLIALIGAGGWWWRSDGRGTAPVAAPPSTAPAQPPVAPPPPAAEPAPETAAAAPEAAPADAIQHPVPIDVAALAAEDDLALDRMISQWLDASAQKLVALPGLAHHIVATIDNLPRSHAAPRLWPLYPVGGKMQVEQGAQGLHVAPGNSARYNTVVDFITGLDPAQVARWYRQAYPVLQAAYENLGYPGQYFNDRLVTVIDHLQQTPNPAEPLALRLVEVQGEVAPQQPWLRYELADPDLQALSAGQKILLRLGPEHRQRVLQTLQALRTQITQRTP